MPFHVELSAGLNRARVFNLSREELASRVIEPWLEGRRIELGDREWTPRDSSLKVLEGAEMEQADLAFGQGWANAERGSENVTRRVIAEAPPPHAPDAFVIETDSPESIAAEAVAGHQGQAIPWSEARQRIDGRDPEIAAVILVLRRPGSEPPQS